MPGTTPWPTASPCSGCAPEPFLTTEANQATYLADELRLVSTWDYVAGFIWYELFDRGPAWAPSPEDHYGHFRHNLSPKPAAQLLRSISEGVTDRGNAGSSGLATAPAQP